MKRPRTQHASARNGRGARAGRRAPLAVALSAALAWVVPGQEARAIEPAGMEPVRVDARTIRRFSPLGNRAGLLTFLGGAELRGRRPLASLSGLARTGPDRFLAVSDGGDWVALSLSRDANGRIAGARASAAPIDADVRGRRRDKGDVDAEAVALMADGSALVAFEHRNRILRFDAAGRRTGVIDLPIPQRELRRNKGLEAVAASPPGSRLAGAAVTVAERSIDRRGDIFAAILSGPGRGVFTVRRTDGFDVTDAAFLPDGDLILLERRYRGRLSLRMRLRRIPGAALRRGARVDGPVLMEAGLASEIDNMEGLTVHTDDRGTVLTLVSDDNDSFLQRTLLLEFLLPEGAGRGAAPPPEAAPANVPVPTVRPRALGRLSTTGGHAS